MLDTHFKPTIHKCNKGNHFHLITGENDGGVSPAFASIETANFLIDLAVDEENPQDLVDEKRLKRALMDHRVIRGGRNRELWIRKRPWEGAAITQWANFINGNLRASEMEAFIFFSQTACDFINVSSGGKTISLSFTR